MATGDSGREAYTAIAWGVGLSHERSDIAGAEGFHSLEGNMCGTARRGADALPGSKATSRAKGSHRNLGGLVSGRRRRVLRVYGRSASGRRGAEADDARRREVGPRHSSNEAGEQSEGSPLRRRLRGRYAAVSVERRAGAKGNTHQQSTYWTQSQARVTQRAGAYTAAVRRHTPEAGAVCGKAARTDSVRGRAMKRTSLPLPAAQVHHAARWRGSSVAFGCGGTAAD